MIEIKNASFDADVVLNRAFIAEDSKANGDDTFNITIKSVCIIMTASNGILIIDGRNMTFLGFLPKEEYSEVIYS